MSFGGVQSLRETKASMPIGVFDSGLGGLTVLSEINRVLPNENLVYFGDTARVPYGNKSSTTIIRYSREITKFLLRQNVKAIVVACNTASSYALEAIRELTEIPVLGVIDPAVRSLITRAPQSAVAGLIATKGTISSASYEASLGRNGGNQKLVAQPCPLLVPLIEEGYASSKAADLNLARLPRPAGQSSGARLPAARLHALPI
jgi:glutamate racemase